MGGGRWRVRFSGSVQGVGFRETTRRLAEGFAVTGFVRNLSDGRVELVAEGSDAQVGRFLEAVRGRMAPNIDGEELARPAATGEFAGFSVRR